MPRIQPTFIFHNIRKTLVQTLKGFASSSFNFQIEIKFEII